MDLYKWVICYRFWMYSVACALWYVPFRHLIYINSFASGIKPLSIYGLVHFFQAKGSLVHRDHTLSEEDRDWILAILSEHLLDDDIKVGRKLQSKAGFARSTSRGSTRGYAEAEHLVG